MHCRDLVGVGGLKLYVKLFLFVLLLDSRYHNLDK